MITQKSSDCQISWQKALQDSFRDPTELLNFLEIPPHQHPALDISTTFNFKVPLSFAHRMRKKDLDDPLLRQVLPLAEEKQRHSGYLQDPTGDLASEQLPGVLHKYPGRVLLVTTPACAIHCRYCFRRHFPYQQSNPLKHNWQQTLKLISQDSGIEEIILSGGDPLSLSNSQLHSLFQDIANIKHIKRLRIHTRQIIVLPSRIDTELLNLLHKFHLPIIMVVHINHANEINSEVQQKIQLLKKQHITLLNQSVLLKGVNDNQHALQQLSKILFATGILPYYLHVLDPVQGAAHFAVSIERAKLLIRQLQESMSGYLIPRLVQEIAGEKSKTAL